MEISFAPLSVAGKPSRDQALLTGDHEMFDFKQKTVLITGASMGIGAEFARQLAKQGAALILVARSDDKLRALADELRRLHQVRVDVWSEDLARPGAALRVRDAVRALGRDVDVLVNNAGFGAYGAFDELPIERQRAEIDLNVGALVELTHAFLPEIERAQGGVIHVASTAAFQPVPYLAVYAASKAFVLSFSEALWGEYRKRGVRVLALCPGATETPFFEVAGEQAAFGTKASPSAVVRVGLAAFSRNQSHVVHGIGNYIAAQSIRLVTRQAAVRITQTMMKPKQSNERLRGQTGSHGA
jgi:short-subunit dehydrogenase